MHEVYHDLTPEETVSVSDLLLKIARRICGSHYVDDLTIRIEREKSVLKRSIATARQSEFARLLAEADSHFVHALTVFQDFAEVKSRIDSDPIEQSNATQIFAIIHSHTVDSTFSSRKELLAEVEAMVSILETGEKISGMSRLGILPLFIDLKSRYTLFKELVKEVEESADDLPPPSVAGRRLAATLRDLHRHVEAYSRLGNREYKKLLTEINRYLDAKRGKVPLVRAS